MDKCETCPNRLGGACIVLDKEISKDTYITCLEYDKKVLEESLRIYKLAYEWKCNGMEGSYKELLDQAQKTVRGWDNINKKGYGEVAE